MMRCRCCNNIFQSGEAIYYKGHWVCPKCKSLNIVVLSNYDKKPPFKYNKVKVKYEEGEGHE